MTYIQPNISASNDTGSSYQGIIDALNTVRAANAEPVRYYPPNYQGIISAILGLKKWGQGDTGETPPGWSPITDNDGNIVGGNFNPQPENGTLWFDTRQGRLFIWYEDGFYQTNGGDGLTYMSEGEAPNTQLPGATWYDASTNSLYVYVADTGWTIVNRADGDNAVSNTRNLPLANATQGALALSPATLPNTDGLRTQEDMNLWSYQALELLDNRITAAADGATVTVSATAPEGASEGDLWYNSDRLELLVAYDTYWVPASLPLTANTDFSALSATVASNNSTVVGLINAVNSRIAAVESTPVRTLSIDVDQVNKSLQLLDSQGSNSSITLSGVNGIAITANAGELTVDGSALQQSIQSAVDSFASNVGMDALLNRTNVLETDVAALQSAPSVSTADFSALQDAVALLPTQSIVDTKVSAAAPVFTGDLDLTAHKIVNLGTPVDAADASTKAYTDAVKDYANSTFVKKLDSTVSNLRVNRSDLTKPAIDFSTSQVNGRTAFKFKTNGGDTVTFGSTDVANEYAWEFTGNEKFSYIGANGVVSTADKDGLMVQNLFVGDITRNGNNEQVFSNKIDIKERLVKHESILSGIKTSLQNSTDFDQFKTAALIALSNL